MFRKSEGPIKKFFKQLRIYFYNRSKVLRRILTISLLIIAIISFNQSDYRLYVLNFAYKIYGESSKVINDLYSRGICQNSNNTDLQLLKENNELKLQNTILTERLQLLNSKLHFIDNSKHKYITAIVTQVTYPRDEVALVVSAGEEDGVRVGNVVIDDNGIVGRVSSVSKSYSVVSLIGNENVKISALITPIELDCIIGRRVDKDHLEVSYLSDLEAVSHGNKVISSGKDGFTPYGITIGTIEKKNGKVNVLIKKGSKSTTVVKIIIDES